MTKEQHKKWREANKDKIKGYYLKSKDKNIERAKQRYYDHKEDRLKQIKAWASNNKDKIREYKAKWKANNKHKRLIQQQTTRKYGGIKGKCLMCDNNAVERHHYTEPYEVDKFWELCTHCHNKVHRK